MFAAVKDSFDQRWRELSSRDRKALTVLLISLLLAVVIFALVLPTLQLRIRLEKDLLSAEQSLQEIQQIAPQLLAQNSGRPALNSSALNNEIRRQAARYGVIIARFEPDGEQLRVWLEDVRYPSVIQWLGALQAMGISHRELTLEDRQDPGYVSARITFAVAQ